MLPCLAAACSSSGPSANDSSEWFSKPMSFISAPDWMKDTGPSRTSLSKPIPPEDLMSADGRCAGMDVAPLTPPEQSPGPVAPAVAPAAPAGVALGMSECEVMRRTGQPDNFEVGANPRGERSVVLTYSRSSRPGIYRFASGALTTIERGPEPPPLPKPVRPAKKPPPPRTAAAPPAPPAARPVQPAPQQQQATWPSTQARPPAQTAPWPQTPAPGQAPPPLHAPPPPASPWPAR